MSWSASTSADVHRLRAVRTGAAHAVVVQVHDAGRSRARAVSGSSSCAERGGVAPAALDGVLHGTTVATNALLEHDGGRTGMLTTEGFRDIIHIGRHQRPHNFSLMQDIPFQRWPLVERKHRKTVSERVIPPGEITTPLDEERCVEAILELKAAGVESICVCFLFAFLDPSHELRAGSSSPSTTRTPRSPCRTRSSPSSASSSASRPPPRTPTSSRRRAGTSTASPRAGATPASPARSSSCSPTAASPRSARPPTTR